MSRLLLPTEKFIPLPPTLAGRLGIVPALVLCELSYRAGPGCDSAGFSSWVDATVASLRRPDSLFFVSEKTILRALEFLKDQGVIELRAARAFHRERVARVNVRHSSLVAENGGIAEPDKMSDSKRHIGVFEPDKLSDTEPDKLSDTQSDKLSDSSKILESEELKKNPERARAPAPARERASALAPRAPEGGGGSQGSAVTRSPAECAENLRKLAALTGSTVKVLTNREACLSEHADLLRSVRRPFP